LSLTLSKGSCILLPTSYLLSRINGDCACPWSLRDVVRPDREWGVVNQL